MKKVKKSVNSRKRNSTFTEYLRTKADSLWKEHHKHEFVIALGNGSLPKDNFELYIRQDAKYLNEFRKVYAYAIIKTEDPEEIAYFSTGIQRILQVEQALHQKYGEHFGFTPHALTAIPMTPTNYAYTRHLLHIAATGSIAEIITAILPCAWLYADIARVLVSKQNLASDHPYFDWLTTYASPEFDKVKDWLCDRLNQKVMTLSNLQKKHLEEIFLTSTRYEWFFWEMAWKLEKWPGGKET